MTKFKRSIFSSFLTLILLLAISAFSKNNISTLEPIPTPSPKTSTVLSTQSSNATPEKFLVKKIIDGDTIELDNGQKVRYIGIDTPETVDPRKTVQCLGKEASNKNKELVEGKWVRMEKDVSETDRYKRLLRFIYISDGNDPSKEIFVNDYLVRQGFAHAVTYPPDTKYSDLFREAEKEARENNRGLWGSCPIG
jgi:micrococcal nuclease